MHDGEKQERRAQDRRDAERETCWKGGIHERRYSGLDWRDSGLEGYKRRVTGKEGSR